MVRVLLLLLQCPDIQTLVILALSLQDRCILLALLGGLLNADVFCCTEMLLAVISLWTTSPGSSWTTVQFWSGDVQATLLQLCSFF